MIQAAQQVFWRYGFRRVTMNELAEAAQMSRPALYLVYPSKEEIFTAVVERMFETKFEEVRQGVRGLTTVEEQLTFAFEAWSVQAYAMIQSSPDAKDLLESSYEFAAEATAHWYAQFTALVASILEPLAPSGSGGSMTADQISYVMVNAVPGFKRTAESVEHLRRMIGDLIKIVLASLPANALPRGTEGSAS
ncbi:TetR family transcriptional regulator [Capsulimonas corticalis]|uniref:TetR family transcriptional regulator n=1 Tax=Capsulimonas corticalis TaxID=2219043 RepID=A0A9N7L5Y1_9BACT|nr:TetR family transcriptional regulator [Capsulimonas corticalis]